MGFCGKSGFLTFAGLNDTTSRQLIKKVHNSRKGKKRVCENSQTRMDSGGDEGDRTPDLLNAIQALSQLSYAPKSFTNDIMAMLFHSASTKRRSDVLTFLFFLSAW